MNQESKYKIDRRNIIDRLYSNCVNSRLKQLAAFASTDREDSYSYLKYGKIKEKLQYYLSQDFHKGLNESNLSDLLRGCVMKDWVKKAWLSLLTKLSKGKVFYLLEKLSEEELVRILLVLLEGILRVSMYRPIIRNLYVLCFEVTIDFQVGNVWADHEIWVDE